MLTGIVVPFAGPTGKIPDGWVLCDGSKVSRTESRFRALFDVIGTTYGGDAVNEFRLPDFRGMFLRGVAGTRDDEYVDPDRDERKPPSPETGNLGNRGNNVGSIQNDAFLAHEHPLHDPGHKHAVGIGRAGGGNLEGPQHGRHFYGYSKHWGTGHTATGITMSASGGPETRPPNAYVHWIIKL